MISLSVPVELNVFYVGINGVATRLDDEIDVRGRQQLGDPGGILLGVGHLLVGDDVHVEAGGAAALDALAVAAGDDDGHLGGEVAGVDAVEHVPQRATAAGQQHAQADRLDGVGFVVHGSAVITAAGPAVKARPEAATGDAGLAAASREAGGGGNGVVFVRMSSSYLSRFCATC